MIIIIKNSLIIKIKLSVNKKNGAHKIRNQKAHFVIAPKLFGILGEPILFVHIGYLNVFYL